MHKTIRAFLAISALFPTISLLQGCHVQSAQVGGSTACTVSGPNPGTCTVTVNGSVTIVPNAQMQNVAASDLQTLTDGSYTISASVPSASFSSVQNGQYYTTISATTDTGYSSSISLTLNPVAAAVSPVNSGDIVYSFALPNTPQLDNWIQTVAANTGSTMSLSTSNSLPIQYNGGTQTYTFTAVLTSNSTGPYGQNSWSTPFQPAAPGGGNGCGGNFGRCYPQ